MKLWIIAIPTNQSIKNWVNNTVFLQQPPVPGLAAATNAFSDAPGAFKCPGSCRDCCSHPGNILQATMSNRETCNFFFSTVVPDNYRCNICSAVRKQAARTGTTNLISHLATKHPNYREQYSGFERANLTPLEAFGFADQLTQDMYDWAQWITA
jgi:hypothetical protein